MRKLLIAVAVASLTGCDPVAVEIARDATMILIGVIFGVGASAGFAALVFTP